MESVGSLGSVRVGSGASIDTASLDLPFDEIIDRLPQQLPIKTRALLHRLPTLTGKEKPLQERIKTILALLQYSFARVLRLDTKSDLLLDFKHSTVDGIEYELTFDTSCYQDESMELGRIIRFGRYYNDHYEYRLVALLNIVDMEIGQVLLLAMDKDKGYIGIDHPVLPPIILNIPLRYISYSLFCTYRSPTVYFYQACTYLQKISCH